MSFTKAINQLTTKSLPLITFKRTCYPYYHVWLATPPKQRIAYAEKVFWGIFMTCGVFATPAWVLTHLDDYKGKKKEAQ